MLMHAVGLRLGKTIEQISDMPVDEFVGWLAFFEIVKDRHP